MPDLHTKPEYPIYRVLRKMGYSEEFVRHIKYECHIKARACSPKSVEELSLYEKKMAGLLYSLLLSRMVNFKE